MEVIVGICCSAPAKYQGVGTVESPEEPPGILYLIPGMYTCVMVADGHNDRVCCHPAVCGDDVVVIKKFTSDPVNVHLPLTAVVRRNADKNGGTLLYRYPFHDINSVEVAATLL
ncbi:hypothetical protein DNK77_28550 [Enterobacter cloacae complex sp.]|uniref:hypothetical protein n=1 Tax=Enterobacter cloacae complex TaxID=354276 RepID=UPI000D944778|nr:hypothetical protein [Enterobacter cloacae complex sp.]PYZ20414.1 hypothetical protein DNK77_28550 [Enterobacter cloacae complex sp.]